MNDVCVDHASIVSPTGLNPKHLRVASEEIAATDDCGECRT